MSVSDQGPVCTTQQRIVHACLVTLVDAIKVISESMTRIRTFLSSYVMSVTMLDGVIVGTLRVATATQRVRSRSRVRTSLKLLLVSLLEVFKFNCFHYCSAFVGCDGGGGEGNGSDGKSGDNGESDQRTVVGPGCVKIHTQTGM